MYLNLFTFPTPLVSGKFLKRYKRFLTDVELENGELVVAHCPNSGSMKSCLAPHCSAYLTDHGPHSPRKLKYTLELLHLADGLACVNTQRANDVVETLLQWSTRRLKQGSEQTFISSFPGANLLFNDLKGFHDYKREATYKSGTRFDYCLYQQDGQFPPLWLEIKSVSYLLDNSKLAFPDAITERGQKHLMDLMEAKQNGSGAMLWYVVMRSPQEPWEKLKNQFSIAKSVDPQYANGMSQLLQMGVEVRVIYCDVTPEGLSLRAYTEMNSTHGEKLYA